MRNIPSYLEGNIFLRKNSVGKYKNEVKISFLPEFADMTAQKKE